MAVIWLAPDAQAVSLDPDHVAELLLRHAPAGNPLQHLRIRASPDARSPLMVFGFLIADEPEQARRDLRRLAQTAITIEPALRQWRLI